MDISMFCVSLGHTQNQLLIQISCREQLQQDKQTKCSQESASQELHDKNNYRHINAKLMLYAGPSGKWPYRSGWDCSRNANAIPNPTPNPNLNPNSYPTTNPNP